MILIGDAPATLGGSEYLATLHAMVAGVPPELDLAKELAVQRVVRDLIQAGLVRTAHDVSIGGLAVAPGFGSAPMSTGDSGRFGGNMDFNEVVEGNTVYLPVFQPGALLYLGDAHALQGDGETSQYALETSMDVEFTVKLIPGKMFAGPRVEDADSLMAMGIADSLNDALKQATTELTRWIEADYRLTPNEAALVIGTAIHYDVAEVADPQINIVARISKAALAQIPKTTAP